MAHTNSVARRIWATPIRLLAALALALAVIAGLLAMHAMSGPGLGHGLAQPLAPAAATHSSPLSHAPGQVAGDSAPAEAAATVHAAASSTHLVSAEHPDLTAPADSGHTMLLMACALALLVALLLVPALTRTAWRDLAPTLALITATRGRLAPRRRPSLIFLSISRT